MTRIWLLMAVCLAVTACANGKPRHKQFMSSVCNRMVDGFTPTKIWYGDAHMKMKATSDVIANSELRYVLVPDKGFGGATVTITEKNTQSSWTSTSGSRGMRGGSNIIVAGDCVPQNAAPGTIYEFEVNIAGIGTLDPRVRVVRK